MLGKFLFHDIFYFNSFFLQVLGHRGSYQLLGLQCLWLQQPHNVSTIYHWNTEISKTNTLSTQYKCYKQTYQNPDNLSKKYHFITQNPPQKNIKETIPTNHSLVSSLCHNTILTQHTQLFQYCSAKKAVSQMSLGVTQVSRQLILPLPFKFLKNI